MATDTLRSEIRFLSAREIRNHPGRVWKLVKQTDLVLTVNGKPVAVLVGVEEDELEQTMTLLRRLRAQQAVSRIRRQAKSDGLDRLTPAEIDEEIHAVRRGRRSR